MRGGGGGDVGDGVMCPLDTGGGDRATATFWMAVGG